MVFTRKCAPAKVVICFLCFAGFSNLANQISQPRHPNVWANQKMGHSSRSFNKGVRLGNGYSAGSENYNRNYTRHNRHNFDAYQANLEAIKKIGNFKNPNSIESSSSFIGRMASLNISEDSNAYLQFDQPHHGQEARPSNVPQECKYPCPCNGSETPPTCKAGVNVVMDGCGCCQQCGRQMGDLCNAKDKCDVNKSLYCDFKLDGGFRGFCRARNPRACNISGKTVIDGQNYQPNCSLTCTCQDGKYACASLCPQELRPPSATYCRDAQLVSIDKKCCKEWVCPNPHHHPLTDDTLTSHYPNAKACQKETTDWSSCSVTCGTGESMRVTSDNAECRARQERRLCIIRPCGSMTELIDAARKKKGELKNPNNSDASRCPSMVRTNATFHYEECESVKQILLSYCTTCRKCCVPETTQTIDVTFRCPEGKTVTKAVMSIDKCVCKKLKSCNF